MTTAESSAPSSPRITRLASTRCCSSGATSTSWSIWTSWATTNSGARRAPLQRLGNDRLPGNVPGRRGCERSKRIKLATGVVSLPYHHPFNVAQRIVQLDTHDRRCARDLRLRPRCARLRRPYARN